MRFPTLGETDVFKSIQLLPGVQASDETASGLTVRGGTPAQNLGDHGWIHCVPFGSFFWNILYTKSECDQQCKYFQRRIWA